MVIYIMGWSRLDHTVNEHLKTSKFAVRFQAHSQDFIKGGSNARGYTRENFGATMPTLIDYTQKINRYREHATAMFARHRCFTRILHPS